MIAIAIAQYSQRNDDWNLYMRTTPLVQGHKSSR